MKMKWLVIAVLSMALTSVRLASAAEEDEGKEAKTAIPATATEIWQEVTKDEQELGQIIADKKLNNVHEVAYAIRDLVNALPDKSADLSADKLDKVKSNAKYVAAIAKRLDESGDAGDQAATEANFKKLQNFLKAIEAQYSSEAPKIVQ